MSISEIFTLILSLHTFLETVYVKAGKRTKRIVAKVDRMVLHWAEVESNAFRKCKDALARNVTLSYIDETQRLVVHTNASDKLWSGTIKQVSLSDLTKPHEEQRHTPLAFSSGLIKHHAIELVSH